MARCPTPLARLLAAGLALALLLLLLAGQGDAHGAPQDCCLQAPPRAPFAPAMRRRLVSHRLQGPATGCLVEAVVFITRKGRELCISPDEDWIPAVVKEIEGKNWKAGAKKRRDA